MASIACRGIDCSECPTFHTLRPVHDHMPQAKVALDALRP